jgi:glycosyltransferase involved in cell wall biosynthesis
VTDRLRVVMFVSLRAQTGGERYALEVMRHLERHGVRVRPICLDEFPRWCRRLGLATDCLACNLWLFRQALWSGLLRGTVFFEDVYLRPRLVLFNLLVYLFTGKLQTVVLVQNVLTNHRLLQNPILRRLDNVLARIFLSQATLVLTNSAHTRDVALARGVDPAKARVVYCGFDDPPRTPNVVCGASGPQNGAVRILFVGQCEPYKGIDVLLRAAAHLERGTSDFQLDIVGNTASNPVYAAHLGQIVEAEQLDGRVRFWGHIGEKAELGRFYACADIFVLPSRQEGFGIVLLEAMSVGLPIVATKAGAIPELVEDGRHGLLVPPDDPQALAQAIQKLCDSPGLRAEYGRNGRARARHMREFYSWEAVGERVLTNLRSLAL